MSTKIILPYTTLIGIALANSGCLHLPPYRMKRRKVILNQVHTAARQKAPRKIQTNTSDAKSTQYIHDDLATHIDALMPKPTITIWIHGTRLLPNPLFHAYMYSPPGLNPITCLDKNFHLRQLADAIIEADPHRYPLDHFYIFGWSGKLDETARKQAAKDFHVDLCALIDAYKENNAVTPNIRIITHSHGGNIALYLADMDSSDKHIDIEELILLACPVQEKTKNNIKHAMFRKAYVLYSSLDMLQVLAPQFMYRIERKNKKKNNIEYKMPIFSSRRFHPEEKLAQIKIKINGHAICHTTFSSANFTRLLPTIIDEINAWQKEEQQYPFDKPDTRRLMSIYA